MPSKHCRPQIVANVMNRRLAKFEDGRIDVVLHANSCQVCRRGQECVVLQAILGLMRGYTSNQFIYPTVTG